MKKISIFGHCRNMLRRLLPHSTKDIRFLGCTVCTDSGENRKPCEALYINRQPRNVFEIFKFIIAKNYISSVVRASSLKIVYKAGSRKVDVVLGTNTGCRLTCIHPLDRNDGINNRRLITKNSLSNLRGFGGLVSFLTSKIALPSGWSLTLNSL